MPADHNIMLYQGDTYTRQVRWFLKPQQDSDELNQVDLTGYTATMDVDRDGGQWFAPTAEVTVDGEDTYVLVTIPSSVTEQLEEGTPGSYDLTVVSPGGVATTLLRGRVQFDRRVGA